MNKKTSGTPKQQSWRDKLYIIIFESHTPGGKAFDVFLLIFILASILVIMLESVAPVFQRYRMVLLTLEWFFTILFTIEYIFRLYSARSRKGYIFSFYGVVDLLSILPTYIAYFLIGSQYLLVIRGLRLLRIFRVLKMARFLGEAETLKNALLNSVAKITVFIGSVLTVIIIVASIMYLIEGPEGGFHSIPLSIYWAIVTITTVGYGDIVPATDVGKALATLLMLLGYGIIAVPTGIVSAELSRAEKEKDPSVVACPRCNPEDHSPDSTFCRFCGLKLNIADSQPKETEKK